MKSSMAFSRSASSTAFAVVATDESVGTRDRDEPGAGTMGPLPAPESAAAPGGATGCCEGRSRAVPQVTTPTDARAWVTRAVKAPIHGRSHASTSREVSGGLGVVHRDERGAPTQVRASATSRSKPNLTHDSNEEAEAGSTGSIAGGGATTCRPSTAGQSGVKDEAPPEMSTVKLEPATSAGRTCGAPSGEPATTEGTTAAPGTSSPM